MRLTRVLVAIAISALATLGLAGAAHAAGELGLSPDGVTWASNLPAPLFDPGFRWVPGDVETASFFVRNQSGDPGVLDVTMKSAVVEDLLDTGDLEIAARVDGGAWVRATTAGPHLLIQNESVDAGAVKKVDVRVTFDPASGNVSESKQFDLAFDVNLHQGPVVNPPTTPGGGGNGGNGGSGGPLPNTGSTVTPALLILAGLLCAAGLTLTTLARRNPEASKERQNSHA